MGNELRSTKTYEHTSSDEKSIFDNYCRHITTKFAVGISENQEKLPTLYWLPNFINDHINHVLLQTPVHLGPNIHWTSNYGTGIVFIGNMLSWLSFHNFV